MNENTLVYLIVFIVTSTFLFLPPLVIFFAWDIIIVSSLTLISFFVLYVSFVFYIEYKKVRLQNVIKLTKRMEECPICFNDVANYTSCCGHNLCYNCWDKIIKIKCECPICRTQLIVV